MPPTTRMPFESLDLLARLQVPEPHSVVVMRAEQGAAAVGRDGDAGAVFIRDAGDPAELPARLQVPNADRPVPTARQGPAAVREDGDARSRRVRCFIRRISSPSLHVPDADRVVVDPPGHEPAAVRSRKPVPTEILPECPRNVISSSPVFRSQKRIVSPQTYAAWRSSGEKATEPSRSPRAGRAATCRSRRPRAGGSCRAGREREAAVA